MAASKTESIILPDEQLVSYELADKLSEKLLNSLMNKEQVEDIEDERYLHIISRSQSRFTVPVSPNEILSIEFHPSGKFLAYSRIDGSLTVWILNGMSYSSAKKLYMTDAIDVNKMVFSISWNANEMSQFATVGNSSEVYIWGIDEKKRVLIKSRTLSVGPKLKIFKCCYDPTGSWLLTVAKSEELHIFSAKCDYALLSVYDVKRIVSDDSIYSVSWNNSGSHVFLGFKSGKMAVLEFNESTGFSFKMVLSAHRASLTSIKMDPYGRFIVTGGNDGTCCIWDLKTLCCDLCIDDFDCAVSLIDIDATGKVLGICTVDGKVRFYNTNSGQLFLEQKVNNSSSDLVLRFKPDSCAFILSGKQDTLLNHVPPKQYTDILSLWKFDHEKPSTSSRNKNSVKNSFNNNGNNRRPNKRERENGKLVRSSKRDSERPSNNPRREGGQQRATRFAEKFV